MVNIDSLVEKLISINRNTRVVTGGKNLSFSALVVVGDKKGRVGFGMGKALEVNDAKQKAGNLARKRLIKVPLKESRTVHHDYETTFGACKVIVRSAPMGTGIISGNIQRSVFEALGIKDIVCKTVGSNNPYNVVMAIFKVFKEINSPKTVADRRGKNINEIIKRRNQLMGSVDDEKKETTDVK
jgi:small subunit ribosomal protein S5